MDEFDANTTGEAAGDNSGESADIGERDPSLDGYFVPR